MRQPYYSLGKRFKLAIFTSILCASLTTAVGFAQSDQSNKTPPDYWTLDSAILWAFENNTDILRSIETAKRASGVRMVGRSNTLPRVRLLADADTRSPDLIDLPPDTAAGIDPESRQAADGYSSSIEIRQALFTGQRRNLRLNQANKIREIAANAKRDDVIRRVIAILTQSYDAVLFAHQNIEIRQKSAATFTRLLDIATKRFEAGDVPELEIIRLKSELNRTLADVARAESQKQTAEERFKRLLSLRDGNAPLILQGQLRETRFTTPFESLADIAFENRMDLKAAKLEWEAAEKEVDASKLANLPQIEAVGGYDYRSSFYDVDRSLDGWRLALVASVDIFANGRHKGNTLIKLAEARSAFLNYESLKMQIESSIRELDATLQQHETILASRQSAVQFAEMAHEQIEAQYEAGATGLELVLDAQDTLNKARFELAQSIYNYNATIAQLEYTASNSPKYSLVVR